MSLSLTSAGATYPSPDSSASVIVGRGPVPRHASVEETALVGVRFSRRLNARGGQAPALRCMRLFYYRRARACPSPVFRSSLAGVSRAECSRGTGPRATVDEACAPVRDQAIPNYGLLKVRRTLMSIARADAVFLKVL